MRALVTILAVLVSVLGACGSASKPADTTPAAKPAGDDLTATCVAVFERQRTCTDEFIPALVDLRIRLDVPPGIAEAASSEGRDALVAQAMEEWKADSTDEAIAQTCSESLNAPPEAQERMKQTANECLATDGCDAFVTCILPVLEQHLAPR